MIKRVIPYEDFDGNPREKTCYFHFTEAELAEMEVSVDGGLSEYAKKIAEANDKKELVAIFKKLVLEAYCERDPSGEGVIKSKEISDKFSHTEAYSNLFMQLAEDDKVAAEFFNGLVPKKLQDRVEKLRKEKLAEVNGENKAQIVELNQ